ncbi:RNase H-fold protein (predicted Holliday junction resolvase) [Bradyrhizobium sp. GM22.5]
MTPQTSRTWRTLMARERSENRVDAVAAMILLYQFMKENSQRRV